MAGIRANASATSMAAATTALDILMEKVSAGGRIGLEEITGAHAILLADDSSEQEYGGRLRDVQNWIGGSDHSPRGARYIPPPPETVLAAMEDLLAFAHRDDVPALAQAAIAHAQCESIHPFTDGNGRIGRALINAILRRRGVTTHIVLPLASALVSRREEYCGLLSGYQSGRVRPLLVAFAEAARTVATESSRTADRLSEIPVEWRAAVGAARAGSAVFKLLDRLPTQPILSADEALELIDAPRSSVFAAIARLHDAGVLRPLTSRQRNQVWAVGAVLEELNDLGVRIAEASRPVEQV